MYSLIFKNETTLEERMDTTAMAPVENLCAKCQYLNRETGASCSAFPDGIPLEIIMGDFDHTYEYDRDGVSDNGVTFSPLTN